MSVFVRKTELSGLIAAALKGQDLSILEGLGDNEILLKNTTVTAQSIYSVFHVGDSILTPTSNESSYKFGQPALKGEEVSEDDDAAIAVVQKPANVDKLIPARAAGITRVRLVGDADKTHATTKTGEYTLEAADSGPCLILYDPGPGGSERIALVRIGGGGGACECEEIHRFWTNGPDGGEFHATYEINSVAEEITWDWDATAYDIRTAFEAHSEIEPGDVEANGGPWPFVAVYVKFKGALAATSIDFPVLDNADLTNGAGFMDKFTAVEI